MKAPSLKWLASALAVLVVAAAPSLAYAWSSAHDDVTSAAFSVQPQGLIDLWSQVHSDPYDASTRTIDYYLIAYGWWTGNPDHHDGPNPPDINRKRYISNFLYGELNGTYAKPVPYGDPDYQGTKPKTFHYLTYSEAGNEAFSTRAGEWYFDKIVHGLWSGNVADAAQYAGTLAHAIEDRSSVYHAWDGYSAEREQFETDHGIQGSTPGVSDFWRIYDSGVVVDISGYTPQLLGATIAEAAAEFATRLQAVCDFSRNLNMTAFYLSHVNDDWENRLSSAATDLVMNDMAVYGAYLLADVFYTSYELYQQQVPLPSTLVLFLLGAACATVAARRPGKRPGT